LLARATENAAVRTSPSIVYKKDSQGQSVPFDFIPPHDMRVNSIPAVVTLQFFENGALKTRETDGFTPPLGIPLGRLQQFIQTYFARSTSHAAQNVDDSFVSFLWRRLCDLPEIRLGVLQESTDSTESKDVPTRIKRSRVSSERRLDRDARRGTRQEFVALDKAEESSRSMEELVARHGLRLRLAANPETCWLVITGGHDRVRYALFVKRAKLLTGTWIITITLASQAYPLCVPSSAVDFARKRERQDLGRIRQGVYP
jgi:hypothetical protein